jgi:hypothetical protein
MNDDYDRLTIVQEYFQHLDNPDDEHLLNVVETVDELAHQSPRDAWPLVRNLIEIAPNEYALDYVVAGPLEILLTSHGDLIAEIIAVDAANNSKVQAALAHVIIEPTAAVRKHLDEWLP